MAYGLELPWDHSADLRFGNSASGFPDLARLDIQAGHGVSGVDNAMGPIGQLAIILEKTTLRAGQFARSRKRGLRTYGQLIFRSV
jgi:hypothetical protein